MKKHYGSLIVSRTPQEVTGKLNPKSASQEQCAEAIRVFAREIFGITDKKALEQISVYEYMGGERVISLKNLYDSAAGKLQALILQHAPSAHVDFNNPKNIEFTFQGVEGSTKGLVTAIESIVEAFGLNHALEQAVRTVQKKEESLRSSRV